MCVVTKSDHMGIFPIFKIQYKYFSGATRFRRVALDVTRYTKVTQRYTWGRPCHSAIKRIP